MTVGHVAEVAAAEPDGRHLVVGLSTSGAERPPAAERSEQQGAGRRGAAAQSAAPAAASRSADAGALEREPADREAGEQVGQPRDGRVDAGEQEVEQQPARVVQRRPGRVREPPVRQRGRGRRS